MAITRHAKVCWRACRGEPDSFGDVGDEIRYFAFTP
jgi:hypothetical protein